MTQGSRPAEQSSKAPVSVIRNVVVPLRKKSIDPRFDRTFGDFDQTGFEQAYGTHLRDLQNTEIAQVTIDLKNETNPNRRANLLRLQTRLQDMHRTKRIREEKEAIKRSHRKQEAILVSQGKSAYYLREADVHRLHLVQQYDRVKSMHTKSSDDVLDKIVETKRKRRASRQRKHMPSV